MQIIFYKLRAIDIKDNDQMIEHTLCINYSDYIHIINLYIIWKKVSVFIVSIT